MTPRMEENMTTLLRTAADFDALPEETLIVAIQVPNSRPGFDTHRVRTFWKKYGRGFVQLDPGDRDNGEKNEPGRFLENFLKGFGNTRALPGVAVVLDAGDQITAASVTDLATGSLVQVPGQHYPHLYLGDDSWDYLDPGDPYDGEYGTNTANLISGEVTIQVLYRPGDEVLAGFAPHADTTEPDDEITSGAETTATLLRTEADFAAVPDDTFVLTIEVVFPDVPHGRARTLWYKSSDFVMLDPDNRDGEESKPAGYLESSLIRFGAANTIPGIGIHLVEGNLVDPSAIDELPIGSIILLDGWNYPHTHSGNGQWQYMDFSDAFESEYPTATANLVTGEEKIHLLYLPGDEERAGFDPAGKTSPAASEHSVQHGAHETSGTVEPAEPDTDAMSPCAQAYLQEYGHLPKGRTEQAQYSAFRVGYERGERRGAARAYADVSKYVLGRS